MEERDIRRLVGYTFDHCQIFLHRPEQNSRNSRPKHLGGNSICQITTLPLLPNRTTTKNLPKNTLENKFIIEEKMDQRSKPLFTHHFATFWTILDHIEPFLTMYVGSYRPNWTILDQIGIFFIIWLYFQPYWFLFDKFDNFKPFGTILGHFGLTTVSKLYSYYGHCNL